MVSLRFVYIQKKMYELPIYPRKIEFLCVCVFIEIVCMYEICVCTVQLYLFRTTKNLSTSLLLFYKHSLLKIRNF